MFGNSDEDDFVVVDCFYFDVSAENSISQSRNSLSNMDSTKDFPGNPLPLLSKIWIVTACLVSDRNPLLNQNFEILIGQSLCEKAYLKKVRSLIRDN